MKIRAGATRTAYVPSARSRPDPTARVLHHARWTLRIARQLCLRLRSGGTQSRADPGPETDDGQGNRAPGELEASAYYRRSVLRHQRTRKQVAREVGLGCEHVPIGIHRSAPVAQHGEGDECGEDREQNHRPAILQRAVQAQQAQRERHGQHAGHGGREPTRGSGGTAVVNGRGQPEARDQQQDAGERQRPHENGKERSRESTDQARGPKAHAFHIPARSPEHQRRRGADCPQHDQPSSFADHVSHCGWEQDQRHDEGQEKRSEQQSGPSQEKR